MKKIIIFMLLFGLLLSMFGCGKKKSEAVLKCEITIDMIGTVTADSEPAIIAAQTAYDSLSEQEKACVENYTVLTEAIATFQSLRENEDKAAAQKVKEAIDGIGIVTLDSWNLLSAILETYNALSSEQQALVGNASVLFTSIDEWKSKYDFEGNYYYCYEWKILNSDYNDITKSKSTYVSLLSEQDKVYIKVSDDYDKLIYSNQFGTFFGILITRNAGDWNGAYRECNIQWENDPIVLSDSAFTNSDITLYYEEGNAYLWFILNGDVTANNTFDAMKSNSIAVYHEFKVAVR